MHTYQRNALTVLAAGVLLGALATPAVAAGNPSNGKKVFASAGCAACHTMKAAGAKGMVGPNLDQKKPTLAKIIAQVTSGGKVMPAFKSRLTASQIQDLAAYVYASTHA